MVSESQSAATAAAPMPGAPRNWDANPVLTVEHLTMRFGGLVAVNDLSFNVGRGDITALIGPNGAGKTTVFNCVTGFYKPTEGRTVMRHGEGLLQEMVEEVTAGGLRSTRDGDKAVFLLERMPDFEISQYAKVARTFQNIRLFGGMTLLENLMVAQHNPLMTASIFTIGGLIGLPGYRIAEKAAKERPPIGWSGRGSSTAPTTRRRTCPMATSAGSRSPARCAPSRTCSVSTSPRRASTHANRPNSTNSSSSSAPSTARRSC